MFNLSIYRLSKYIDLSTLFKGNLYKLKKNCIRQIHEIQNVSNEAKTEVITQFDTKILKVAIIGVPNAGKSTLVNGLMDRKVCPTSNKVHTTRKRSQAIITEGQTQIVFLDTPGIVTPAELKRYKLEKSFTKDCARSLNEANVIGVIHDISNTWTRERLDIKIIKLLEQYHKRISFLVLNKIDVLKSKRKLLDITKILTEGCINSIPYDNKKPTNSHIRGWRNFSEIFMVSALNGDGIEDLRTYLVNQSQPGPWLYPSEKWTDDTPDGIILRTVQATLLDFLPQEIPYRLKSEMELFEVADNGLINAVVLVHCPNERIQKLVVGVGDGKLRQISEKAQRDLHQTFDQTVRLRIVVTSNNK